MRERIWSIREMDVIEYELPEGERAENGAEEAPSDRQEKRTVERENAGETYGATEKTGTSTKIRLPPLPPPADTFQIAANLPFLIFKQLSALRH